MSIMDLRSLRRQITLVNVAPALGYRTGAEISMESLSSVGQRRSR